MHMFVKGNTDIDQNDVTFENNAPFRSCITKTNSTLIGNAEDPNIVIPMHNLLEYSQNYHRDEINVQKKMFMIMLQMVNDSNIRQK